MLYREVHERLLYAAAAAQGAFGAGARDEGRRIIVEALAACGVPVAGPFDGPDLEAAPAVLLLSSLTVEDATTLAVIPEAALTEDLRAALARCDRPRLDHETLRDPALAAAHALVTGETVWPFDVVDRHTGEVRGASLRRPITRIYFVFEWT